MICCRVRSCTGPAASSSRPPSCPVLAGRRGKRTGCSRARRPHGQCRNLSRIVCACRSGRPSSHVYRTVLDNLSTVSRLDHDGLENVPKETVHPSSRAHISWPPLEAHQLHPTAYFTTLTAFPIHHSQPCAFIDGIMDRDNNLHVGLLGIVIFACHRRVELLLARIDPVLGICAWYGRNLAVRRQVACLRGRTRRRAAPA